MSHLLYILASLKQFLCANTMQCHVPSHNHLSGLCGNVSVALTDHLMFFWSSQGLHRCFKHYVHDKMKPTDMSFDLCSIKYAFSSFPSGHRNVSYRTVSKYTWTSSINRVFLGLGYRKVRETKNWVKKSGDTNLIKLGVSCGLFLNCKC